MYAIEQDIRGSMIKKLDPALSDWQEIAKFDTEEAANNYRDALASLKEIGGDKLRVRKV